MYVIYAVQNLINNKLYIGQTNNLKARIKGHKHDAKIKKYNSVFHATIRKYGWKNFKIIEIEQWKTLEDTNDAEKFWIEFFRTNIVKFGEEYGYNLTEGGDGAPGRVPSDKAIESLRQRSIGNTWGSNVVHTDEFKQKVGLRFKDKNLSEEHRENISVTRKKNGIAKGSKNPGAKLNEILVSQIRFEYLNGISSVELSKKFKVSKTQILRIVNNKNWKLND
jgi:group I intron endonuclease